ncbi:MAG: ATP-dependent sacrificial sulfur transferase LarE [Candidatus Aminicenantes bacterium]
MDKKLEELKALLTSYGSAVVAFSGGVDSTFLARVARDTLGGRVLLVTATSSTYPASELEEARELARQLGCRHEVIVSEELAIEGFADNPPDRCYHCKSELFGKIAAIARKEKFGVVCDGSNADDLDDYRPGRRALKELGVRSPLCEVGLTKAEIRELSARMGLPTASKPAYACLASRFPYGEKITDEKLKTVGAAEEKLRALGFRMFRVRIHGDAARLEFDRAEMDRAWGLRAELSALCKEAGFVFVSLDLDGYRTGAMNEALAKPPKD